VDVFFLYRDQVFTWDGSKAIENRKKHGIGFETACEAFFDDFALYLEATAGEESRSAVIGSSTARRLLYVVHIAPEGDQIRIISARTATRRERKIYEDS
jgi:uncharacterized protein